MRISDWSSDVCSSDLLGDVVAALHRAAVVEEDEWPSGMRAERAQQIADRQVPPKGGSGGGSEGGRGGGGRVRHVALGKGRHLDRKSVVEGKSVSVRVDLGGRRIIKKKTNEKTT